MFDNINSELSDYIKLMRFKKKMSQDDVAEILKISRNTYGTWENNPITLSLETLVKVFAVFDEDILYFFKSQVAKSNLVKEGE